ncbi:hypothetical protein M440DRAFT_1044473 [Trichoderma longibrachiatum ATCC 18648]|uniref:Uncharacterized protein n=1 Tax=Trichoderma longibrachiatum ATCC 18648 TaxID=983965 RepID=A0A2T4BYH6_TRILO|nr:hypothetical protein M440DRAFT_1044473 [Trichoderma longibrachiatum ATCC 18648]
MQLAPPAALCKYLPRHIRPAANFPARRQAEQASNRHAGTPLRLRNSHQGSVKAGRRKGEGGEGDREEEVSSSVSTLSRFEQEDEECRRRREMQHERHRRLSLALSHSSRPLDSADTTIRRMIDPILVAPLGPPLARFRASSTRHDTQDIRPGQVPAAATF